MMYAEPIKVYDSRFFDDSTGDGNMGIIGALIGAGVGLLPMITGLFSACQPGQACGLNEITQFGNQVMQTLDQIVQMLNNGLITGTEAVANAQKVAAALSDSAMIYQAKKGKDAAALADFKSKANAKVTEIIAMAAAKQQQVAATVGVTGSASGSPLSSSTLLILGGGLVLLLALKK